MKSSTPGKSPDRGAEMGQDTLQTEAIRRALGEPSFSRGQSYYRLGLEAREKRGGFSCESVCATDFI